MSDQDNIREDRNNAKEEREASAKADSIEFHAENWMDAVTKSPAQSHGTFKAVVERGWAGFERTEKIRPANSVDVFIEELENKDFKERAAQILIDLCAGNFPQSAVDYLFADMAASYAEFQHESQIKELT
jgi:hypothetical protein